MPTTLTFSPFDDSGMNLAESTIRHLVKTSRLPVERLVAIATEALEEQTSPEAVWSVAGLRGEQAKPTIELRSGPSYSTDEVAKHMGVSDETVRKMYHRAELIAYPALRGKGVRFPRWQFATSGGRLRPHEWVGDLLAAYGANGWGLVDFLTVPRDTADGLSYLTQLQQGGDSVDEVTEAAKRSNPV